MKKLDRKNRLSLTLLFSGIVLCFIIITLLIVLACILILVDLDILSFGENALNVKLLCLLIGLGSVILGAVLAFFAGRVPLKPVNSLINAMNRLASGDFSARLSFGKYFGKHPVGTEISESFNNMARELENTEMLRSDFINNFSHEFKTPIVSIAGFAKLLKRGNPNEEEKTEYIDIIADESMRLAQMATNVLALTKVENQNILTGAESFNISELLRQCVLLLEPKLTAKHAEIQLSFDEYYLEGNRELLKEVFINIIDNAAKYVYEYGTVSVKITQDEKNTTVVISDSGEYIPPEKTGRIFDKFYQADESHTSSGNGVGLAIVSKIVKLHGGTVFAESRENLTSFTVKLPNEVGQK